MDHCEVFVSGRHRRDDGDLPAESTASFLVVWGKSCRGWSGGLELQAKGLGLIVSLTRKMIMKGLIE